MNIEKIPPASEIYPREEVILEEFKTSGGTKAIFFNFLLNWPKILAAAAAAAAAAKLVQSCPTLCDPIDRSPPGSTVPGILQARTLEWVAISFSKAKILK